MQGYIPAPMEAGEETGVPPGQQYPDATHAPFAGVQYDFSSDANEFAAIDHGLAVSSNFAMSKANTQATPIADHVTMPAHNGHVDVMETSALPVDSKASLTSSNTPNATPVNPSTKRTSPSDLADSTPVDGDSKRKRSKVSRACDQCRRKKIRCDADAEGTGQLKTCSNCVKAAQTCEYSRIPQKRGPSKGYIKELSERVQQVEGQLALQNSAGYRSSFDGQPGTYDPTFSPADDDGTIRRHSSFSQRSSFADFVKDRFPSIGSWHPDSHTSNPRQPSIAIPPDQQLPFSDKPPSSTNTAKPFWSDWIESPSKRRKISAEVNEVAEADAALFERYYEIVHPQCPILPDSASPTLSEKLRLASKDYQDALFTALRWLPQESIPDKRTNSTSAQARDELESFVHTKARQRMASRSEVDSLVLVWIELLLAVVAQLDLNSWSRSSLAEFDLVRMSLDACDEYFTLRQYVSEAQHDTDWTRATYIAALFGRLSAVSKGEVRDVVPSSLANYLTINIQAVPARIAFLTLIADTLQACLALIPRDHSTVSYGTQIEYARLQNATMRAWQTATSLSDQDLVVQQTKTFGALLSLRCNERFSDPGIVGPVINLAEAVRMASLAEADLAHGRYFFNPISFHTFTLATVTLLELLQSNFRDRATVEAIQSSLEEMKKCLSGHTERLSKLDYGTDNKPRSWSSVLYDMIEQRQKIQLDTKSTNQQKNSEEEFVIDLAALLRRGYASTLVDFATR